MQALSHINLNKIASAHGLAIWAMSSVSVDVAAEKRLKLWQEQGFAADMKYMLKPAEDFCHAQKLLPATKSMLVFCIDYEKLPRVEAKVGFGRVARYAWGRDYHIILPTKIRNFVQDVEDLLARSIDYRIISDAAPLLEREFAKSSGLGFIGKNTMLIRPKLGSFFFLAELIWDVALQAPGLEIVPESCGTCVRCLDLCPTSAIVAPYSLDAGKCISYLSIEKRGNLSEQEMRMLGDWIFGCDICQEVCPFNHASMKKQSRANYTELNKESGPGPLINLEQVLSIRTDAEFKSLYAGTALLRTKREGLLRNAAAVAANTKADFLYTSLSYAAEHDRSQVVKDACLWAMRELER